MARDPIQRALDGDAAALDELRGQHPRWRDRLFQPGGGWTSLLLAALLLMAGALAVLGQAQAFGLFYLTPPRDVIGVLWAWFGSKVPLVTLVWVCAVQSRSAGHEI